LEENLMGLRSAYATLSRPKNGAIVAGILISLYALFGFFVAPSIVKRKDFTPFHTARVSSAPAAFFCKYRAL
jgi:hypothetical protein